MRIGSVMLPRVAASVVAAVAAVTAFSGMAGAAVISFGTPTAISSTSTLDQAFTLSGYTGQTLEQAVNFGSGAQSVATTGGQTINFTSGATNTGAPSGTNTVAFRASGEHNTGLYSSTPGTGSTGFNNVLQGQAWANSTDSVTTFETLQIGNLTVGKTYLVTLLASDQRNGNGSRQEQYMDGTNHLTADQSAIFGTATPTSVIATFTADASTQLIYLRDPAGPQPPNNFANTTLAGFTLYSATPVSPVPEPASLGVLALGATGLLARRRRASAKA